MNAKEAVEKFGSKLVGECVLTEEIGTYPGGWATVIQILPDPNAPDIVMMVSNSSYDEEPTMGIFEYENIILSPDSVLHEKEEQ
jgi:hypothetical protein